MKWIMHYNMIKTRNNKKQMGKEILLILTQIKRRKGSLLVLNKKLQKNWEKLKMVKLPERIMVEHCMKRKVPRQLKLRMK